MNQNLHKRIYQKLNSVYLENKNLKSRLKQKNLHNWQIINNKKNHKRLNKFYLKIQ
jgi:hypothetical protein